MSITTRRSYHHGDLHAALIRSGIKILTSGKTFSLRAVAADAGVSPTATYRHFRDRQALESSIAASGFRDLQAHLELRAKTVQSQADFCNIAQSYVNWAAHNHAIFDLMFSKDGDRDNPERKEAVESIQQFLEREVTKWYPDRANVAFMTALWALVHGLTILHLEGSLCVDEEAIRQAWQSVLP